MRINSAGTRLEAYQIEDAVEHNLLVFGDRLYHVIEAPVDNVVISNQREQGRNDAASILIAHSNTMGSYTGTLAGVITRTRSAFKITLPDNSVITTIEPTPYSVVRTWIGKKDRLLTPDQAKARRFGSKNGLEWATTDGIEPEMVFQGGPNGYFYPASKNDKVVDLNEGKL